MVRNILFTTTVLSLISDTFTLMRYSPALQNTLTAIACYTANGQGIGHTNGFQKHGVWRIGPFQVIGSVLEAL